MLARPTEKLLEGLLDGDSIRILKILAKGEITDQKIAEKMKVRPNTIRRMLNEMHTKGVITYRKEKEKSGWYNYIWRINPERLEEYIASEKNRYVGSLEERLNFEEENHFFQCTDGCVKMEYNSAFESKFKCPLCGNELAHYDNNKDVKAIQNELKLLK